MNSNQFYLLVLLIYKKFCSGLSILHFAQLGSSMSMRCVARLGSAVSVMMKGIINGQVSVIDMVNVGSNNLSHKLGP